MKIFKIGVFTEKGPRKRKYRAYTTYYNPSWEGCRVVNVEAKNGTEAKKKAIEIMRRIESELDK